MDFFSTIIDIVLHLDKYLAEVVVNYGALTYLFLFIIVFCETGLVVTPFLPGDSLLFVVGALTGASHLTSLSDSFNIWIAALVLLAAAVLGDTANYHIGKALGHKLFKNEKSKLFNKKNLDKTHAFYEKHGGKTIILARFIPVIRTFAPFVAGMGTMKYRRFISYNVTGAVMWVALGITAGFLFGNNDFVRENFSLVLVAIVIISCLPAVFAWFNEKRREKAKIAAGKPEK
jgi:membrane-associated protein